MRCGWKYLMLVLLLSINYSTSAAQSANSWKKSWEGSFEMLEHIEMYADGNVTAQEAIKKINATIEKLGRKSGRKRKRLSGDLVLIRQTIKKLDSVKVDQPKEIEKIELPRFDYSRLDSMMSIFVILEDSLIKTLLNSIDSLPRTIKIDATAQSLIMLEVSEKMENRMREHHNQINKEFNQLNVKVLGYNERLTSYKRAETKKENDPRQWLRDEVKRITYRYGARGIDNS